MLKRIEMLNFDVRNLLMYSWPENKHVCANVYSSIKTIMRGTVAQWSIWDQAVAGSSLK